MSYSNQNRNDRITILLTTGSSTTVIMTTITVRTLAEAIMAIEVRTITSIKTAIAETTRVDTRTIKTVTGMTRTGVAALISTLLTTGAMKALSTGMTTISNGADKDLMTGTRVLATTGTRASGQETTAEILEDTTAAEIRIAGTMGSRTATGLTVRKTKFLPGLGMMMQKDAGDRIKTMKASTEAKVQKATNALMKDCRMTSMTA